jgi:hypothetical protein
VEGEQKLQDGDRGNAGCGWTTFGVGIAQIKRGHVLLTYCKQFINLEGKKGMIYVTCY